MEQSPRPTFWSRLWHWFFGHPTDQPPAGPSPVIEPTPAPPPEEPSAADQLLGVIPDVATGLWRLRQKMTDPANGEPLDEMRSAYRHLESTWDAFAQANLLIVDHTGHLFNSGMALKALAFQPTPGLERETIIETIRPSIFLGTQCLQVGEVIVGVPEPPPPPAVPEPVESTNPAPPPEPEAPPDEVLPPPDAQATADNPPPSLANGDDSDDKNDH